MTMPKLSPTEKRILILSMFGFNTTEIARQLSISPNTVRNHLHKCQLKFHTKNRTHSVIMAIALGYITPPALANLKEINKP